MGGRPGAQGNRHGRRAAPGPQSGCTGRNHAPGEARELFGWLRGLPFVSQRGESWAYHDVVRAAMLRLRRAEAPAEWRRSHTCWPRPTPTGPAKPPSERTITWASPDWVDYTREETYHLLCADPHGNLPKALASAVKAAEHSLSALASGPELIADAGRDTDNDRLSEWGQRLAERHPWRRPCSLPHLPDQRRRPRQGHLAVALEERGEAFRLAGATTTPSPTSTAPSNPTPAAPGPSAAAARPTG